MLLLRSFNFKLLGVFVLVINSSWAQYEGEFDGDHEEHSSYSSDADSDRPDYSRYYSGDAQSAPLVGGAAQGAAGGSGFVNSGDFTSFFSPSFYAASNKQEVTKDPGNGFVKPQEFEAGFASFKSSPFGLKDFFEEAAAKQQQVNANQGKPAAVEPQEYEIKPGPSYVSHKVVPPNAKHSKYESEIDDLSKPYNYNTASSDTLSEKVIPLYSGGKAKIVDPKYTPQVTAKNPNNLTPYQKYSFQAQANPGSLKPISSAQLNSLPTNTNYDYLYQPNNNEYQYSYDSAASNVNAQLDLQKFKPSELIKECKKINKHVPGTNKNAKPMDCYVCKGEKGANYEECFYGSESNPKNYYIETSKEYAEPTQITNYNYNSRYKRYTVSDNSRKDDPYEYHKKLNEKYYDNPDYDSSYKQPKSLENEYKFGEESSSSEQIAAELVKSGKNCQKVNRDGMTCLICKNEKNGGNYEQCSYTNAPEEKKYAYVKERKYNSEDEPEETDSSEESPVTNKKPQQFYPKKQPQESQQYGQKASKPKAERKRGRSTQKTNTDSEEVERIKPVNTHRQASEYTVPKHFANIQVQPAESSESASEEESPTDHEDYYYKHFSPSESKRQEQRGEQPESEEQQNEEQAEEDGEQYGYYGEESKKDVEEVLAEFAKKDRSNCKKAEKNGMTCYLCVNKKGLQHEECMYVSESRPQSKYQAYHAQKETDGSEGAKPAKQENAEESKVKAVRASRLEPQTAESGYPELDEDDVVTPAPRKVKRRRSSKSTTTTTEKPLVKRKKVKKVKGKPGKDVTGKLEDDPVIEETKDQYRTDGERGAFSDETDPVYSKQFGTALPKFMLTKSEGELVYDEYANKQS